MKQNFPPQSLIAFLFKFYIITTMAIKYHPERGIILICDFHGFCSPEMTKKRPVVVISPRMKSRVGLCTVVALSTTEPNPIENYHYEMHIDPPLPFPYNSITSWVKGDMVYSVSYDRLRFPFIKDDQGKRQIIKKVISSTDMQNVEKCVLAGMGINIT